MGLHWRLPNELFEVSLHVSMQEAYQIAKIIRGQRVFNMIVHRLENLKQLGVARTECEGKRGTAVSGSKEV